jgi:hypothetical protein
MQMKRRSTRRSSCLASGVIEHYGIASCLESGQLSSPASLHKRPSLPWASPYHGAPPPCALACPSGICLCRWNLHKQVSCPASHKQELRKPHSTVKSHFGRQPRWVQATPLMEWTTDPRILCSVVWTLPEPKACLREGSQEPCWFGQSRCNQL